MHRFIGVTSHLCLASGIGVGSSFSKRHLVLLVRYGSSLSLRIAWECPHALWPLKKVHQESGSGEQILQMQRSRPIVQRAIGAPGPLLGRTIPTEFDIVPIWVIDVDGQAHSIISG